MVNIACQFFETKFTVSGYFKALAKVIENGYGTNTSNQIEIPETGNFDLTNLIQTKINSCRTTARQSVYFALYAALDFMIRTPLEAQPVNQKQQDDQDQQLQLNNIRYGQIISCLINTGLLNRIIQLPQQVDIQNPDDEQIVRLSMKLLITTIFKGQQISGRLMINFDQKATDSQFFVPKLTSIFEDTGIKDPNQIKQIMIQMSTMVQKVHNFEIAQIYDETYVQYLHLLSQITINTIETGTSSIDEGLEDSFLSNSAFLSNVIKFYSKKCSSDNQLQKLMKSDDTAKRIIIYQFFFINYLLSICTQDTIKYASKLVKVEEGENSLAQSIFIILIEILNALSDSDNNNVVDKIIGGRIETFAKVKKEITEQRNILAQINQQIENENQGKDQPNPPKVSPSNALNKQPPASSSSVTMTITKMLLFNLERLLQVVIEVQSQYFQSQATSQSSKELTHRLQTVQITEDELQILVQLLLKNEQHGEIVTRIYDILSGFLDASKLNEQASKNIAIIDMSKSLLQICIKHSSIYQCEPAFLFLSKLVQVSDKYVNKQDVQFSLTKIMPASLSKGESVTNRSKMN